MKTYDFLLEHDRFPSPTWFAGRVRYHEGVVLAGQQVRCNGNILALSEGNLPAEGSVVWLQTWGNSIAGFTDQTRTRLDAERQAAAERAALQAAQNAVDRETARVQRAAKARVDALRVNASLKVPVRWTPAIKIVYSGLTERSNGCSTNRRTVNHVMLLEPVAEGRFVRGENELLCSPTGSFGHHPTTSHDDQGAYESEITCIQCLKIARRWAK